jgi:hypothetical protein
MAQQDMAHFHPDLTLFLEYTGLSCSITMSVIDSVACLQQLFSDN